jgi:hypothetical protein
MTPNNRKSEKPATSFEVVAGTDVPEPFRGRKKTYRPWEAPPRLSGSEDMRVQNHVYDANEMIMRLIIDHMAGDVPVSVKSLVTRHLLSINGEEIYDYQPKFERSLVLLPQFELDDDELEVHKKVDLGTANMQEISSNFDRVGRRSAELALLRIIAGHRSEYVDPMMDELRVLMGAHFEDSKPKKYRFVDFDDNFLRDERMQAIVIRYKKYHGKLGDTGTEVAARHTLVLRTDRASGFDQIARSAIQSAIPNNPAHVPMLSRVRGIFNEVAEEGLAHPFVAAAIIKPYMYNRETAAKIDRRDRDQDKKDKIEAAFDSTTMYYHGPEQV